MSNPGQSVRRRRFIAQFGAALGGVALASCAPPAPTPRTTSNGAAGAATQPGASQTSPAVSKEAGEITFVNWDDISDTPIEVVIQEFQRQTGRKVTVQPTPGRGTEYETKIRTILAGGAPPDIMRVNDDFVRYYSIKQQILDLTPYLERDRIRRDDFFAPIFDFARQPDGTYTAWSIGNQPRLIFYNLNAFKEAGAPLPPTEWTDVNWKWDDFLDRAKMLTVEGKRWGALVFDNTGYEQTFAVNNGEDDGIYSKDGKSFTLASPKGAEAIQWASNLSCVHKVQPDRSLVPVTNPDAGNQLFAAGKVAMIFRGFAESAYMHRNIKDFEWDVAPVPGKVKQMTEGSLITFAIPKAAMNPDGAWELLNFMGGPSGSKIFAEKGYFVPAFKASAALIKPGDRPPAHIELFSKAMEYNTAVNFTENTERARNIYRPELDRVYTCEVQAQEVLNQVRADVEDALAGKF